MQPYSGPALYPITPWMQRAAMRHSHPTASWTARGLNKLGAAAIGGQSTMGLWVQAADTAEASAT